MSAPHARVSARPTRAILPSGCSRQTRKLLIDGERWEAPEGGGRLIVQLDEGEHRIEIRKDGYRPFSTTVRVRRGDTAPLNVSLTRQDDQ